MTETPKAPATLEAVITERIKPILGEMLPEETLRKHVQAMIHRFTTADGGYNSVSPLGRLIDDELRRRAAKAITEYMDANCRGIWDQDGAKPSVVVEETIKRTAPALIAAMFGGVVQSTVDRVLQEMRNMASQNMSHY